jgi:hypothetical protein
MKYDSYDHPPSWTPTRPPDPPPSRIALDLAWRRLREPRADPPDVFEQVVAAMKDDQAR